MKGWEIIGLTRKLSMKKYSKSPKNVVKIMCTVTPNIKLFILTMGRDRQSKRYIGNSFVMLLNQSKNKANLNKSAMNKQWLCNDSSFGPPLVAECLPLRASSGGEVHWLTQADGSRGSHAFISWYREPPLVVGQLGPSLIIFRCQSRLTNLIARRGHGYGLRFRHWYKCFEL